MDANENLNNGKLEKLLSEKLHMVDVVKLRTQVNSPNTFHTGSEQVDGIWITQDIIVSSACFSPFWFGTGDHRSIILHIPSSSVLGDTLVTIKKPKTRRLVTTDEKSVNNYIRLAKKFSVRRILDHKMNVLIGQHTLIPSNEFQLQMLKIDDIKCEGMTYAENKCKKLNKGGIDFSPELRRSRAQFYFWSSLKKYYLQGKGSLTGIYRQAHSINILYPLWFSEETVIMNAATAKKRVQSDQKICSMASNILSSFR